VNLYCDAKQMKSQKGFALLDMLLALAILSIAIFSVMHTLLGSTNTTIKSDQTDTARIIAQAQLEYIKTQPFSTSGYSAEPTIMTIYPGYSATITTSSAQSRDANIQKINIAVAYKDLYTKQNTSFNLQDFKVK